MHDHPCWKCKGGQQCDLPNCEVSKDVDGLKESYPAVCDPCRYDAQQEQDAELAAVDF